MSINFRKASKDEVFKIGELYNNIIEHLDRTNNFSGWKKDVYPTLQVAKNAFKLSTLFLLIEKETVLGTVILNHSQADEYKDVDWGYKELSADEVLVVHTLCINPKYLSLGYAGQIMDSIKEYGIKKGYKTIRLDVSYNNAPAQKLYLNKGYIIKGKISLDVNRPGFIWWHAMELEL